MLQLRTQGHLSDGRLGQAGVLDIVAFLFWFESSARLVGLLPVEKEKMLYFLMAKSSLVVLPPVGLGSSPLLLTALNTLP